MFDILHGAIGVIHSINEVDYTARVKLLDHGDNITKDLQILTPLSFSNKINCIPSVDTPVMVMFFGDRGYIIGAWNSENNRANESKGKLIIDFQKSKVIVAEDGNIQIDTEEMIINSNNTVINSKLKVNGETELNGDLSVTQKVTIDGETKIKDKLSVSDDLDVTGGLQVEENIRSEKLVFGKDFVKI